MFCRNVLPCHTDCPKDTREQSNELRRSLNGCGLSVSYSDATASCPIIMLSCSGVDKSTAHLAESATAEMKAVKFYATSFLNKPCTMIGFINELAKVLQIKKIEAECIAKRLIECQWLMYDYDFNISGDHDLAAGPKLIAELDLQQQISKSPSS